METFQSQPIAQDKENHRAGREESSYLHKNKATPSRWVGDILEGQKEHVSTCSPDTELPAQSTKVR